MESGAEAPHSMECGDSSPLFGEGFSLHPPWQFQMFCREHEKRLRTICRRDLLVRSA
ncbi:hypothetical protein THTE_0100 [Thermogutta terrifontis]|uniref:Uncharacterized protein n=1 Tax=Thermogutta terrifontis TaxID=1331910 RepID=A0A286R9R2_9BACT|nr:hypothetical protein THTE_0100 [Thermogutta terrifontis]